MLNVEMGGPKNLGYFALTIVILALLLANALGHAFFHSGPRLIIHSVPGSPAFNGTTEIFSFQQLEQQAFKPNPVASLSLLDVSHAIHHLIKIMLFNIDIYFHSFLTFGTLSQCFQFIQKMTIIFKLMDLK